MASLVTTVSGERIGEEVRRMLVEGYSHTAFTLLEATGLLHQILPEVATMRDVPQPEQFHPEGCVLTHTMIMLAMLDETMAKGIGIGEEAYLLNDVEKEILAFAVLLLCFVQKMDGTDRLFELCVGPQGLEYLFGETVERD